MSTQRDNGVSISLDDLIALNDEFAALVRAGIPLGLGLRGMASELPGKLSRITARLSEHLDAGDSLPEAFEREGTRFPAMYRAVVRAGLRSGRLAEALESVSRFATSVREQRRQLGLAILYPFIVLAFAYLMFVVGLLLVVERVVDAYSGLGVNVGWLLHGLLWLSHRADFLALAFPIVLSVTACWWFMTGASGPLGLNALLLVPGLRGALQNARWAAFAELLQVLVDHQVPADEAVVLAARATGSSRVIQAGERVAQRLQRGDPLDAVVRVEPAFPPMMRWMISTAREQGDLATALLHASDYYARLSQHRAELFRTVVPPILVLFLGGAATFVYAMLLFLPMTELLKQLGAPV